CHPPNVCRRARSRMPRVIAFPHRGIAYTECLYTALGRLDCEILEGEWSGRWLMSTVEPGDVIQIHWPSFLYYTPESNVSTFKRLLRLRAMLEMARWRGARIVWTAHNLYPHDAGNSHWAHRRAREFIVSVAEKIFVHGAHARTIVAKEFDVQDSKL